MRVLKTSHGIHYADVYGVLPNITFSLQLKTSYIEYIEWNGEQDGVSETVTIGQKITFSFSFTKLRHEHDERERREHSL